MQKNEIRRSNDRWYFFKNYYVVTNHQIMMELEN
jgi:hypothetical protein